MKKQIRTIFTSMLLLLCTAASAQWTNLLPPAYADIEIDDIHVSGNRIIAVGTYLNPVAGMFIGHIFTSRDGGATWDTIQDDGIFYKTIAFKDNETGFIGGYGAISVMLKTTDGGETWSYNMVDTEHKGITNMQFFNSQTGIAIGYGSSQFSSGNSYKTTDGGETWTHSEAVDDSLPLQDMFFVDEYTGYASASFFGYKTLAKTTDGGKHWKLIYQHNGSINDLYFWNADEGIFVDYGGVYKTMDGGKTWIDKTPAAMKNKSFSSITFLDRHTGFAVSAFGNIYKTTDGGETWQKQVSPTTETLNNVEIHENKVYITGAGGIILRSSEVLTAVTDAAFEGKLNIYPNPASSLLSVSIPGKEQEHIDVKLIDTNGRLLITGSLNASSKTMDISAIPDGLYMMEISAGEQTAMKKIMVRH